jgi:hypothetical protein
MIPKHRSLPDPWSTRLYSSSSHFFRTARGSFSHGLASTTAFMKALRLPMLFAIGPNTEGSESWPSSELRAPQYGTRPYDGLRPYKPQNALGSRIELSESVSRIMSMIGPHPFHTRRYQNRPPRGYLSGQAMQPPLPMTHSGSGSGCVGWSSGRRHC